MSGPCLRHGLVLTMLLGALPLLANGGTPRIVDARIGGYLVSIYTDPTPARPDSLDVSVLVVRRRGSMPVEGLDIRVRAERSGGSAPPITSVATRSNADDPRYYASKFRPGEPGDWRIEVTVRGADGSGALTFGLEVREPGLLDRPWIVLVLALLPLGLLTLWLARSEPDRSPEGVRPAGPAGG